MKLIHLTDTHLVPSGERLYGLDPEQRLQACVASINEHHGDADLVLVTGDLAHRGEPEAYQALRRALDELRPPLRLILGNHDDRAAFRAAFPEVPADADGFIQDAFDTAQGRFLLLDTNEPGVPWGIYCETRRRWLAARLAELPADRQAVLFLHHPPFPVGLKRMDEIALQQPEAFAEVVRPHAHRIRHLFFGHLHRPLSGSWQGIPFSTLRGTNHQVALDFRIAGVVPGSHEPPQYAVVLLRDDAVLVHLHDYLDRSNTFVL